jgi:amidase
MNPLNRLSACQCVEQLHSGDVCSVELVKAAFERVDEVNPVVNALPLLCREQAIQQAAEIDSARLKGEPVGTLGGLPIAVKDYNDVAGVATTYGSPLYKDYVPTRSDATVEQLQRNGAIPIGKSNVPEWAGGHTFNPVYGSTANPWNLTRSAGGSSGGSAVALATGMVPLATGNDLGGSLRTPSAFNGVVGLRPGPGIVPRGMRLPPFDTLWVEGPMARCVDDIALMLDAGAGLHADDPLSLPATPGHYQQATRSGLDKVESELGRPLRVAYSSDLGVLPVATEVADLCSRAAQQFAQAGADITDDIPDFTGVTDAFQTLRGVLLATMMGDMLQQHRDAIAPEIIGNIELGLALQADDIFRAERVRHKLHSQIHAFFQHHDVLVCPASSITAFPADQRYVTEIDGKPLNNYIDWFAITFVLTMTSCPVISVPCGLSADGLPVAVQLMGRPRGEARLLQVAKLFEELIGFQQLPIDPKQK